MKQIDKNIYQRGEYSFQVKMMVKGKAVTHTCDSLAEARTWRDQKRVKSALDADDAAIFSARIKRRQIKTMTVEQALDKYIIEITPRKKGAPEEIYRIGKTKRTEFAQINIYMVTPEDVLDFLKEIGGSENNQRKYASLISHLFTTAKKKWRLEVRNPVRGEIDLPSNGTPRDRRLIEGEYEKLVKHLPSQAKALMILAIETAARRGELMSLKWSNIKFDNDGKGSGYLPNTKNGKPRTIPFSSLAITALKMLPKGTGDSYVFDLKERKIREIWETTCEQTEIEDLHWHDLRHEGCSRLFEQGLNIFEVQSISGHESLESLRRYVHLSTANITKKLI